MVHHCYIIWEYAGVAIWYQTMYLNCNNIFTGTVSDIKIVDLETKNLKSSNVQSQSFQSQDVPTTEKNE